MARAPAAERVAAIKTGWIREYIRHLESQVRELDARNRELFTQIEIVGGKQHATETDVRADLGDSVLALPPGTPVIFQDKFEVSPSEDDPDVLDIELRAGHGSLVIIPQGDDIFSVRALIT